ncbi:MAG: sel1 repeat family protein [Deltaproteobacteria bacterium]|nr:sel1 repeat family protein [Deltaproteobacteria bacterium]
MKPSFKRNAATFTITAAAVIGLTGCEGLSDMETEALAWGIGGIVAAIFCLLIALAAVGTFFRGVWSALKGDVVGGFWQIIAVFIIFAISIGAGALSIYCIGNADKIKTKISEEKRQSQLRDQCFDGKEANACYQLCRNDSSSYACSKLFSYGLEADKNGNHKQAAEYYDYGCRGDNAGSCTNLGVKYEKGEGVSQSVSKAAELCEKACNLGEHEHGCTNAGMMYMDGNGVARDKVKAFEFFEKGCAAGNDRACRLKRELIEN